MKFIRKVHYYCDRISHEIRLMDAKRMLISGAIFLLLGITPWFIGGAPDKVNMFFIFPRCALPIFHAFTIWGISFLFCGIIFGGVLFGCEKYKRGHSSKVALFIAVMHLFTICVYPTFFGALSPFFAFILLLISLLFCFLSIMSCVKLYSLWTICLSIHFLWLLYNSYLALAFTFVN